MRLLLAPALVLLCTHPLAGFAAQPAERSLKQREVPCQVQYARAVETIGLARWSAPEPARPSIERLLNAAARAKELVDAAFLQFDPSLCSADTLGKLRGSVDLLQHRGWLPSTPAEQRDAQAAAANAELIKAIGLGSGPSVSSHTPSSTSPGQDLTIAPALSE